MHSINLIDAFANLLNCKVEGLHDFLNHPTALNKVNDFMKGKNLRTTYLNRNLERKPVKFSCLSLKCASNQHAYEGYLG